MEDIQVYNFIVKSSLGNYKVDFIENLVESLNENLINGDVIIMDVYIYDNYKQFFKDFRKNIIFIKAHETKKSYEGVKEVISTLIENGFRKSNRLIAVGGGITQDVTAFIASILYRGVNWIFYPTTLLAQGDSCIGSKTSINFGKYKNQLGGFYPPENIYIYMDFLKSLPESQLKSGVGEMFHYFVVAGKKDFIFFKNNFQNALSNLEIMKKIIIRSLLIKRSYIEKDEFDTGIRQVFNYGHSFGHAIEGLTEYTIPHGIAVSIGIDIANYVSFKMNLIDIIIFEEIHEVVKSIYKGYSIDKVDIDDLVNSLKKDKKNVGDMLGLILIKDFGQTYKELVLPDINFKNNLKSYFKKYVL
jgi:3-dehydroquinate synthase